MINIKTYKSSLGKCYSCESVESLYQIKFDTETNKAFSVHTILLCKSCMKLLNSNLRSNYES